MSSHFFFPSVGGIEEVSRLLAVEFVKFGHELQVVTQTSCKAESPFPYRVVRNPGLVELLNLMKWCEVFFQNNVSLRTAWPLLFVHRPWVVAHHTWIARSDGRISLRDHLKRLLLRRAVNVGGGPAMADQGGLVSATLDNPYDADVFRIMAGVERTRDLIFVGRLVSDKGVDLLLDALAKLGNQNLRPNLLIVGSGPEEANLRAQTARLELGPQVTFAGTKTGEELAILFNQHRIAIVPSRWKEPFGLVALLGIACGCFVIGSEEGGLKLAIGSCGATFPNGNVEALASRIANALASASNRQILGREIHLERYHPATVANQYLQVFERARKE